MHLARLSIIAALACLTGIASAQRRFTYDIKLVVTENTIMSNGVGGQLATLALGTLGELRIVIDGDRASYLGWNTETIVAHDILEISITAGSFSTDGRGTTYPTTSPFMALQFANNDWTSTTDQIRTDALQSLLVLNSPEVGFSSLELRQDSDPGQTPQLFTSLMLPTLPNILEATSRIVVLESSINPDYGVTFLIYRVEGSSDCPADTNGDGFVSPADFSAWVAAFNANLPACDVNADQSCSPADFSAWVSAYNAGCP